MEPTKCWKEGKDTGNLEEDDREGTAGGGKNLGRAEGTRDRGGFLMIPEEQVGTSINEISRLSNLEANYRMQHLAQVKFGK